MPMTTKERTDLRQELVGQGYSWKYIDEWPTKTTLYWHRDNGVKAVGSAVRGVPGSPDYVNRKARIGLFPWPPSEACTCRWCAKRDAAKWSEGEIEGPKEGGVGIAEGALPAPLSKGKRMRITGADYSSS